MGRYAALEHGRASDRAIARIPAQWLHLQRTAHSLLADGWLRPDLASARFGRSAVLRVREQMVDSGDGPSDASADEGTFHGRYRHVHVPRSADARARQTQVFGD